MKIARLVPVAALFVLPFVTGSASAEPCAVVYGLPASSGAIACVAQDHCLVYAFAGGEMWTTIPLCL